jgi:hypothetical protein
MAVDPKERVYLNVGLYKELSGMLSPGMVAILYDEELEVEATIEFDQQAGIWLAQPNWSTRRDL